MQAQKGLEHKFRSTKNSTGIVSMLFISFAQYFGHVVKSPT